MCTRYPNWFKTSFKHIKITVKRPVIPTYTHTKCFFQGCKWNDDIEEVENSKRQKHDRWRKSITKRGWMANIIYRAIKQ